MKNLKLTEKNAPVLLAMIICARATSFMFSKLCLETMNSFSLISIRFLFASLLIFIFFGKRIIAGFTKSNCFYGCIFGLLYTCVLFCELTGLKTTPTGIAAFLENMAIVLVPLIESLIFRKKEGFKTWFCGALALLGVGIISFSKNGFYFTKGQIFLLLAALFYSLAIITTSKLSPKGDAFVMGFFQILTTGIVSFLITVTTGNLILPSTPSQIWMIVILTVVCTCFGFTLQPVVQSKLPSQKVALFCALGPFTAVLLGAIFLKESFTVNTLIGEGCIMVSLIFPLKEKHSEKIEVCNICKKAFYLNESLKAHLNSHYQKCKICNENVLDLKKHITTVHPSEVYMCPICNERLITLKRFIKHWERIHKGKLLKDFISS